MKNIFILFFFLLTASVSLAQTSGYMNFTTIGILAGTSSDDKAAPLSFVMEHHYRFKAIAPGIFTGIEQLNENLLPVAADLKLMVPVRRCIFFTGCMGGYSVSLEKPKMEGIKEATGGFLAGAEIGFLVPLNSCSSIVFAMGYRYNELNYKLEDLWLGKYKRKITYNRFSVRMGIAFN
jgi:hypothetical protein